MTDWTTPKIKISVVEDKSATARCDRGFLRLQRLTLQNQHEDGQLSEAYPYDMVQRDALDAVVVVLHRTSQDGAVEVCVRSSLRPPLAFRDAGTTPLEGEHDPVVWEVPAGLIEPDEKGMAGVRACAARETLEETGYSVAADAFEPLGPPCYLSPGVLAEQLHYCVASVDGLAEGAPTLDGSPVEAGMKVLFMPLPVALEALDSGRIADAKSEVALRRFAMRSREQ